jgi:predicted HTH transcriptional regulator
MAFCFNHLSLSGEINGTYREEHLEVPAKALREALVNALVHRLYVKRGSSVSLAIYDDRIEIINPGTFPSNLTMAELRAGNISELRNPTIAKVMYSRKTVETWGRGIKLIWDQCAKASLPEPQIVSEGGYTKTVFWRPDVESQGGKKSIGVDLDQKGDLDRELDDLERRIVEWRTPRAAFFDAAYQADGEAITLLQLMESMFELGFLDVSDMRWRTPTKTFRKNGK